MLDKQMKVSLNMYAVNVEDFFIVRNLNAQGICTSESDH